jgi:hypothetical protein
MKTAKFKKLVSVLGFLLLVGNATPLFAQLVELEILGGGYKLRGPSQIDFPSLSTTTSSRTSVVSFADIGDSTPSQADYNYLLIIDENGGNPFDVTVSTTELKRNETLQTTTIAGSVDNQLKVTSTAGLLSGDSLSISGYGSENEYYQIESVSDETTVILTSNFIPALPPDAGLTVNRVVRCDLAPKRCISLGNFAIKNGGTVETVYGNDSDFGLNAQTDDYASFRGAATTLAGSSGTNLYVDNAYSFSSGEEISFPLDSGVDPLTNTVDLIVDENTLLLTTPFVTAPAAGLRVESIDIRNLTLGNGNGASPGQWKIFPFLQNTIPAGQLPGTYEGVLNFTIV